jgi:hypothetical protein
MKIHISHNKFVYDRILPIYRTLQKTHDVTISDSIETIPSVDVWIVDWFSTSLDAISTRVNAHESQFLNFKGKLLPISLDDGCVTYTLNVKQSIINRIDGWFTGIIWDNDPATGWKLHDDCLKDKFILIPRFMIDHAEVIHPPERTNRIVFYGSTTGALNLNGKNPRVEALKIIEGNPFLKSHFEGGLTYDYIIDVSETPEYRATYQHLVVPHYHQPKWLKLLSESTLCPNMEGNGLFSYRPLETMRAKAAMLSPQFFKDPGVWLFAEKLRDCFWMYKRDLSDFAEVCERALLDRDKSRELAENAYECYKDYFETTPDNTFNAKSMEQMKESFEKLTGILL